jgi:hypothetical protein
LVVGYGLSVVGYGFDNNSYFSTQINHLWMRKTILTLMSLILLNFGMAGQSYVNLSNSSSEPKYKARTFSGKAGIASLEAFGMEAFCSAVMIVLPRSITNWEDQYWLYFGQKFKSAYTSPPVWDHDPWVINYIGHPIQGAIFFNSLRSQDCSFWASAGFNVFHTLFWEYALESIMEQPSIQDLIVTPVAGSVLGELLNYLTKRMRVGGFTTGEKILVTLINPTYVVNNGYR